jgi:GGDEF domain-containing protein
VRPVLRSAWVLVVLCWVWLPLIAMAVPQVSWGDQVRSASEQTKHGAVSVNMLELWEAMRVDNLTLTNQEFLSPDEIWQWPSERFTLPKTRDAYFLQSGQRYVGRLTLFSESIGTDLNLSAVMPRLDAIHVSYRYDNSPWKTLSAGDTLPMESWQLPDRQPSFDIPQLVGQLDLIVQVAHRGNAYSPLLVQNDRAYVADLTHSAWSIGMMTGISLIMALVSALLAANFRRLGFLSLTLMSLLMAIVIFFDSGLGGLYLATSSQSFNDEIKFLSTTLWCLALPWVSATALGLHQRSRRLSTLSAVVLIGGAVLSWFWMDYRWRDSALWGVPALLICTLLLTSFLVFWASLGSASFQPVVLAGLLAYVLALMMPFTAFMAFVSTSTSSMAAAVLMMLSALLLISGLYARHRMGRQVMARAKISPLRDVLTGLLNREGMQEHLYNRVRERTQAEQTCAVFIYIDVLNADQALYELGEQGFEMGMVQIAASLSTSVSGVDGVARISRHAFAIVVMMPPDPALATRLAQKILSRLMTLASHGTSLAGTVRMMLSWLPLYGFRIDGLERRSQQALQELEGAKRIGWIGGSESHAEAALLLRDARLAYNTPSQLAELEANQETLIASNGESSNLYERIHRIEREMLHGVDTRFLIAEAERMSRELNKAHSGQDDSQATLPASLPPEFANTEQTTLHKTKPA